MYKVIESIPRVSGGEPALLSGPGGAVEYSPRERGNLMLGGATAGQRSIPRVSGGEPMNGSRKISNL